ncbi:MAG: hypothetical protein NDJ90_05790 [Oligoflexia bacterium]|nr:hypothetical protein [Oligoflexia bacterium]
MERQTREPRRQDPYRTEAKPAGTPSCADCGSVNLRGKWYSAGRVPVQPKIQQARAICPACRQLRERCPLGVVELHGDAWKKHNDTVRKTIERTERIARVRNDQERVLWYQNFRNITRYYVTLPLLAQQIGRTLRRAFKGKVEYHRSTEEPFLRVVWLSDAEGARGGAARKRVKSRHLRSRGARGAPRKRL